MTQSADDHLRLFARSLAILRSGSVAGQLLAIAVAEKLIAPAIPVAPLLAGASALCVLWILGVWRLSRTAAFTPAELGAWLAADIAQLTYMLYLTGGGSNPLITLLIMPIALAAMALPIRHVVGVTASAGLAYGLLMVRNVPLPLHAHDPGSAFSAHLLGMAVTFAVCGGLLAFFVSRLAREARRYAASVQQERERALRDEGLLAIAVQAAGAAHELNTPLSTMATLVTELQRDTRLKPQFSGDLAVLRSQIDRCRDTLRDLVAAGTGQLGEVARERSVERFIAGCADRLRLLQPGVDLAVAIDAPDAGVRLRACADLDHAVINLLNNACEASAANGSNAVRLKAACRGDHVVFEVRDFGIGLPREVRPLGRSFFSSKANGLGLGLALASATAERYRGSLRLDAPADGAGAVLALSVPLASANPVYG